MDKTIHKYTSLDAMKADEYRAWRKMLPSERLDAAAEHSTRSYRIKDPLFSPLRFRVRRGWGLANCFGGCYSGMSGRTIRIRTSGGHRLQASGRAFPR